MLRKNFLAILAFILFTVVFAKAAFANIIWPSKTEQFFYVEHFALTFLIITTIVNALFETLILFFWGLKGKKKILSVLSINLISWPVFYYVSEGTSQFLIVVGLELLVIIFETFFIYLLNKELKPTKLFFKVVVANILSAVIGTYILSGIAAGIFYQILSLFI